VPLLGVLPGTAPHPRVDKRKVRRDRADVFCTLQEGSRPARGGVGLVDALAPRSRFERSCGSAPRRWHGSAGGRRAPRDGPGVAWTALEIVEEPEARRYRFVTLVMDRGRAPRR